MASRTILGLRTPAVQKQNGMEVSWKMSPPRREKRGCCRSDQRPRVQLRHCVQLSCTRGRRRWSRLGCRLRTPRRKRRSRGTSSWCTASLGRVGPGGSVRSRPGASVQRGSVAMEGGRRKTSGSQSAYRAIKPRRTGNTAAPVIAAGAIVAADGTGALAGVAVTVSPVSARERSPALAAVCKVQPRHPGFGLVRSSAHAATQRESEG